MLGFPVVPNMSAMRQGKPRRMRLEQVQFISFVLRNSCVKCYVAFLKRYQNGKYALTVDRKDIKVCFGDEKSKSLNNAVKCLYSVFSKSSSLTCDSFWKNRSHTYILYIYIYIYIYKSEWGGLKRGVVSREGFATFNTRGRLQRLTSTLGGAYNH